MEKHVHDVNDSNFDDMVIGASRPTVVVFWAPWYGLREDFAPAFEEFAKRLRGKVNFYKLNIDGNPRTVKRFNVRFIPTVIVFERGAAGARGSGERTAEEILKQLEKRLSP